MKIIAWIRHAFQSVWSLIARMWSLAWDWITGDMATRLTIIVALVTILVALDHTTSGGNTCPVL